MDIDDYIPRQNVVSVVKFTEPDSQGNNPMAYVVEVNAGRVFSRGSIYRDDMGDLHVEWGPDDVGFHTYDARISNVQEGLDTILKSEGGIDLSGQCESWSRAKIEEVTEGELTSFFEEFHGH